MKVRVIPIVIGDLSTDTKYLLQGQLDLEITRLMETMERTALLRSVKILRTVLETCGDLSFKNH